MRAWGRSLLARGRLATASSLLRNSAALISGTVLTQGIVFLCSPLLARVFGLADFGALANFNAWVAMLALLSCLRYEHAIYVAKDRSSTNRVIVLTASLFLLACVLYEVVALWLRFAGPASGYLHDVEGIIPFIPVGVLMICGYSLLTQLAVRGGHFKTLALATVMQAGCTVALQLLLGWRRLPHSLIVGSIVGYTIAGLALGWRLARIGAFEGLGDAVRRPLFGATAREFINFPRYTMAADALGVVAQQFTPVFLLGLFSPALAGLYAFSVRVVRIPMLVVSGAIVGVLRREGVEHLRREGDLATLFPPLARALLLLGLVPFVVVLVFGPQLFTLVFGAQWGEAGRVVRILSPGILLEFVALPQAVVFVITGTQRYTFWLQLGGFGCLVAALWFGSRYSGDFFVTCYLVSAVMVAVNGAAIVLARRVSRRPAVLPVVATPLMEAG